MLSVGCAVYRRRDLVTGSSEEREKQTSDVKRKVFCGGLPRSSVEAFVMGVERRGQRPLGIPTVEDRVAQMVVVMYIAPRLEAIFHDDSYGYRPMRSAHSAIAKAIERCNENYWVLDMDISKFFDTIDHGLLMKAVQKHVSEKWILLYIERWLKVPYQTSDGRVVERTMGVPQG